MIIDLTISNFKSIKEPVTISALATNVKEYPENTFAPNNEKDIRLLKSIVIYGANASGKSNILNAFETLQNFILGSTDLKLNDEIPFYFPFKLDKAWSNRPSMFEIEFIGTDLIRYRFSIKFNKKEVLKEALSFFPKGQEANLYFREKGKKIKFGDYFSGPARTIEKQLLKNNLFLSKAANSNNKLLENIYLYFLDNIDLQPVFKPPFLMDFTTHACINENLKHIDEKLISYFLKVADVGIEYMNISIIKEKDMNLPDNLPEEIKKELIKNISHRPQIYHKLFEGKDEAGNIAFDIDEESAGTKKLYELAGRILNCLNHGYSFIVDELSSSLHPLMTQALINLFHQSNKKNAQLIFATHDTTFLTPELFRRDQVWFTEKDQYGATSLYSLSDFDYKKVRSDIPFDKWYLSGRFGALPVISGFNQKWL